MTTILRVLSSTIGYVGRILGRPVTQAASGRTVFLAAATSARSSAVPYSSGGGVLKEGEDPAQVSNKEWSKRLTPDQYYVCREKGTEIPFTGDFVNHNEKGIFICVCCGTHVFSSETKYDSGSGWPSFFAALKDEDSELNVTLRSDNSLGMSRIEVMCKNCDAHLGHVFPDGPKPTGDRYCINSTALDFKSQDS